MIINGEEFVPYIAAESIQERIEALANEINEDYKNEEVLFIAVLNGSFMFASDLFKCIQVDASISFIKLASYKGTTSTGRVLTAIGLEEILEAKHVVIVEDIVDTGKTLNEFLPYIKRQNPLSIKIASLLTKPSCLQYPIVIDYLGFEIEDKFVVGFGLDFDGLGRNIPELLQIKSQDD